MAGTEEPPKRVPLGEVSPELSSEVTAVRDILYMDRSTDAVIICPMHEGYDPLIASSGVVQLGKYGIEDFQQRFGGLSFSTDRFYVGYMTLRAGLEDLRNNNPVFALQLKGLISELRSSGVLTGTSQNKAIRSLLGYQAASIMLERVVAVTPANRPEELRAKIKFAADKKRPGLPTYRLREERLRAMRHFSMSSMPDTETTLYMQIYNAVRNRG